MSRHPLGPWTETHDDRFEKFTPRPSRVTYKVGGTKYSDNSASPALSQILGTYNSRTGFNSGRKRSYTEVRAASRTISEVTCESFATARSANYPITGATVYTVLLGATPQMCRALPGWTTPLSTTVDVVTARNMCYRELVQAINMQDVMAGVMAAEGAKTARGLTSGASAIVSAYNKTYAKIRGRLNSRASKASMANQIANDALNLNLNLLPLCADLDGALEALADTTVGKKRRKTVYAQYVDKANGGSRSKQISPAINNVEGFNGQHREWSNGSVVVKMGCEIDVSAGNEVPPWKDVWGLSPQDFVPTVYEVLPYSWLVDYLTSMGSFVDALSLHRGIAINGWKVEVTDLTTVYEFTPKAFYSGSVRSATGNPCRELRRTFTFKRDPFNVDGFVPAMELRSPTLGQAVNMLALATSKLTGPLSAKGLNPEMFANAMRARSHSNVR